MLLHRATICSQVTLVLMLCAPSVGKAATSYTFTTIDPPAANQSIYPQGINDGGQIVGSYVDSQYHGFLLSGGNLITIDYPGAVGTFPYGITNSGQIAGSYWSCYACNHGFLLSTGSFTTIDHPGYTATSLNGINNLGQIVGSADSHGFLLSGGNFSDFNYPGYPITVDSTVPFGINDGGQIVGFYFPPSSFSGFLLSGGNFSTINYPGAVGTAPYGINNSGQIVGYYIDSSSQYHGFLLSGGNFSTIDYPGAINTAAYGINNLGQIVGAYSDSSGQYHGFLAAPAYNVCLLYDPTKAAHSGSTIPIKLQLCSVSGANLSSSALVVHAVSISLASTSISGTVQDSGNANPDNDFRYDATLGTTGGYIFNLSTKGLSTGTYNLNFTVQGSSTVYSAPFQVK